MSADIPSAAKTLLKKLDGWSMVTDAGTGTTKATTAGEPRGDGTCPRIETDVPVDSYLVHARHVDGREFVAVWVHRHGDLTPAGGRKWKLDTCWRGRAAHELTPKQLTATELKAYIAPVLALDLKEAA